MDFIRVRGAKTHNLKNIDIDIPRNQLVVITGLSGSGKSSLAFDTIYAEGQRKYVESLSTYARQFLQSTERPDVESIDGLSPAISIDQKTAPRNPRSTVGTVTEIYDFLRLLFAKIGHPVCPECGRPIERQTIDQIIDRLAELPEDTKINILAPLVRDKKGEHKYVIDQIKKDGFVRYRVDNKIYTVADEFDLDPNKKHNIEIVIDRIKIKNYQPLATTTTHGTVVETPNPERARLAESLELAMKYGNGLLYVQEAEVEDKIRVFSERFACPHCDINLPEIEPSLFSFNNPQGACVTCHGLGNKLEIDPTLVVPNTLLSLEEGALHPWAATTTQMSWYMKILAAVCKKHKIPMDKPWSELAEAQQQLILYGSKERYEVELDGESFQGQYASTYEGLIPSLERRFRETDSDYVQKKIEQYMKMGDCPKCHGRRLRPEALAVQIAGLNIVEVTEKTVVELIKWFKELTLSPNETKIANLILKEVKERLAFLQNVGLEYLDLARRASTLSGGEAQRIRLATQIGSKLQGVLYVLDEPSIGLHQRDNSRLIETLKGLRDLGNTVIVVEHDDETMLAADHLIDIGPGAGALGGYLIAQGTPTEVQEDNRSITGHYLSGKAKIAVPAARRPGNGSNLKIVGATEHNLKNVSVDIPLGKFVAVTGVSGSGKSTLINDLLVNYLQLKLNRTEGNFQGAVQKITGYEMLDKLIDIDQSPIGRTPRSNPATYTGVFGDIRDLFAKTNEARLRGYKSGRFSFNVRGGRCEACQGDGLKKIEMHFLPDIYVTCEVCKGQRYNRETLEVTYRGKNIAEVLDLTVDEAAEYFKSIPAIAHKLVTLQDVGLGYIHLGQSATTLSGGEAQRIKLANELARRATGKTLYILDEPTTGLHFADVDRLLQVINRLVEAGNSVLVIEHNMDVIKSADWVIDLGPEGGDGGGLIVAEGTPEQVAQVAASYTGQWLKKILS